MKMTKAFTMIELIYVIVVLGILGTIALPKFAGIRDQADIANGRAQIATIRTAIANERQRRLIMGQSNYIAYNAIDNASGLFGGVLTTGLVDSPTASNWTANGDNGANATYYQYFVGNTAINFVYADTNGTYLGVPFDSGEFNCDENGVVVGAAERDLCRDLVQ